MPKRPPVSFSMDARTHAEQPYRRWLPQALRCLADRREPGCVMWTAQGDVQQGLFDTESPGPTSGRIAPSEAFHVRARRIACHRDVRRWDVLYRVLWRICAEGEHHLLECPADPDVRRFETFDHAVTMDTHRMKGFLRFQKVTAEQTGDDYFVAHYEPDHRILGWVVPYFAKRLGEAAWAILTPDASVTCTRRRCRFGPGVRLLPSEDSDGIAALWRRYYRATFNPERANTPLLDKNLPPRYRRHLTEAPTIDELSIDSPPFSEPK